MADTVAPEVRRRIMAAVPTRDSKPEITVRRLLHRLGYRFRLHRRDLPGTPDIVLPGRKSAIFVHGCFWHQHEGCKKARRPKSNVEYWNRKLDENIARDTRETLALELAGWRVIVVWECELNNLPALAFRLTDALEDDMLISQGHLLTLNQSQGQYAVRPK